MFAKCGVLSKAAQVLEDLPARDVVSWNAMIAGYARDGQAHEALECFALMRSEGLSPNEITFACILSACSCLTAVDKGIHIHNEIANAGLLGTSLALGNALVNMYAKCGLLERAHQVLKELPLRDTVSWSALIAGYARKGQDCEVKSCLEQMLNEGVPPNELTFLSLLNAFSHSGKSGEGERYYENMREEYGVSPDLEHHACMVMLFGSAGHFDKAMSIIQKIPSSRDPSVWLLLLGSCKKWGNVKLGRLAFDSAIALDDTLAAAYILMSSIYSAAGMQDDAQKVKEAMKVKNAAMIL
jgi:pentatricopeptide repeat protein